MAQGLPQHVGTIPEQSAMWDACTHFLGLMRSCFRLATVVLAEGALPLLLPLLRLVCQSQPMGGGASSTSAEEEEEVGDGEEAFDVAGLSGLAAAARQFGRRHEVG